MSKWLVKGKLNGKEQNWVWDADKPLGVGHPFRWILEQTPTGIRVRDIKVPMGQMAKTSWREISFSDLEQKPNEFTLLDLGQDAQFEFRKTKSISAPFEVSKKAEKIYGFQIFAHRGPMVLNHGVVDGHKPEWLALSPSRKPLFRALFTEGAPLGAKVKLSFFDVSFRDQKGRVFQPNSFVDLSVDEIQGIRLIQGGGTTWSFVPIEQIGHDLPLAASPSEHAAPFVKETFEETQTFKKGLLYTSGSLVALLLLTWIVPKLMPEKTEDQKLLPDQFTKIILTPRKAPSSASNEGAVQKAETAKTIAPTPQTQTPSKKVQASAVVQAFRAAALQNSVHGLLKGGMTKLLEQSDIVTGRGASQDAKRLFDAKTTGLPTAPEIGSMTGTQVAVNEIGGGADGAQGAGGSGKEARGVGYGKGHNAAIQGQGKGFVSMDLGNSSVDEGLSKDEVGEVIHRHLSEIRYCYESAMVRAPETEGKLVIHFVIGGVGKVKSAEVMTSTLSDPRLDDCVIRRLMSWKFPEPKGGINVNVNYPFIFKTLGR